MEKKKQHEEKQTHEKMLNDFHEIKKKFDELNQIKKNFDDFNEIKKK